MTPIRLRATVATLTVGATLLAAYAGFAWIEATRGHQVYPPGVLSSLYRGCGGLAAVLLAAATGMFLRNRAAMAGERPAPAVRDQGSRPASVFSLTWCLSLFTAAVLFAGIAIRHSRVQGRLAFPPFYDDVQYFDDALDRLHLLYDHGIWAVIRNYLSHVPHAPTSTLLAASGYSFFGTNDWAPPLMNALLVFGILLFVRWVTRGLPLRWSLPIYGFTLSWPFTFLTVVHCIPDFLAAIATAIGAWLMIKDPRRTRDPATDLVAGCLFGLALLAKPAMFPVTGFILGGASLVSLAIEFVSSGRRGLLTRGIIAQFRVLAACLAICGPHYLAGYRYIWDYIHLNTWSPRADLWKFDGSPARQLLYHITGPGGQYGMGPFMWVSLIIAGVALIAAIRRRLPIAAYVLPWLAVFLFGHAVVSVTSYKSVFLGMFMSAYVFVTAIGLLIGALRGFDIPGILIPRWAGKAVCLGIAFLGVALFRPQPMRTILAHVYGPYPTSGMDFIREAQSRREAVARVTRAVSRRRATVGVVRATLYSVPFVFQFQMKKDRARSVSFVDATSYGQDDAKFQAELAPLDYVVYLMPDGPGNEGRFMDSINQNASWKLLDRIPSEFDRSTFLVLERVRDWTSLNLSAADVRGFSPPEGPYAPATFRVRWGLGPDSSIPFEGSEAAKLVLELQALALVPGQELTVSLDGQDLGKFPVNTGSPGSAADYTHIAVPVEIQPGSHALTFHYSTWSKAGDRPLAVLFREIGFTKQ